MLTAGLLTPRSQFFPSLGTDWLNGLKSCLRHQAVHENIKLIYENIGFGIAEQDIYAKTEKLLLQDEVDLVVLFAEPTIAAMLSPLFTATNKLLLVVNFGANFPENWQPYPNTFTHTLQFSFLAGLTGKQAAATSGKETANVISYYDGGYRQCFSMLHNHQANGGSPLFTHVTHIRLNEFSLAPLEQFLEAHPETKTILSLFSGKEAAQFLAEAAPIQEKHSLRIFASPMMLEEGLELPAATTTANVTGHVPWHSSLELPANKIFKEAMAGKCANYFSVLGWETGLLLQAMIRQGGARTAADLEKAFRSLNPESPRGPLHFDMATNHSYGPAYLAERHGDGTVTLSGETSNWEEEWQLYTKITLGPGESSSWRNTYLCM